LPPCLRINSSRHAVDSSRNACISCSLVSIGDSISSVAASGIWPGSSQKVERPSPSGTLLPRPRGRALQQLFGLLDKSLGFGVVDPVGFLGDQAQESERL